MHNVNTFVDMYVTDLQGQAWIVCTCACMYICWFVRRRIKAKISTVIIHICMASMVQLENTVVTLIIV